MLFIACLLYTSQKTLSKAAALVVCEQFLQTPGLTTEAALKEKYEEHLTVTAPLKKLTDWDFYKNCLDQLTGMGLSLIHILNILEEYIQNVAELLRVFMSHSYTYYINRSIEVQTVKDFYQLLLRCV